MREALSSAYSALQGGRPYKRLKKEGLLGVVRCWEATAGVGGWHLHAHILVFHRDGPAAARAAGKELIGTWISLVGARGFRAVREAQNVQVVTTAGSTIGDYGAKAMRGWGAAAELAAGWCKSGRRPDRLSIPQVLGLAAHGDPWAERAYVEAVSALKGMRVLVVGPALKAALGVTFDDVSDEDAVEPEAQDGVLIGEMPGELWSVACRRRRTVWCLREVRRLSVRHGVEWCDVLRYLEDVILYAPRAVQVPDG